MKVRFFHPGFLVWMVVPVIGYLTYLMIGLPHIAWNYSWRDNGTYNPDAIRYFTSCEYLGPYGVFRVQAQDGWCPWIRFYKEQRRSDLVQGMEGLRVPVSQVQEPRQLNARKAFLNRKHGFFADGPTSNLVVTVLTGLEGQIVRSNLVPELLIAKRLKPFHNVFNVVEITHAEILSKSADQLQI